MQTDSSGIMLAQSFFLSIDGTCGSMDTLWRSCVVTKALFRKSFHLRILTISQSHCKDAAELVILSYWDYTLDAGPNLYKAPVFSTDPEIGFGDGGSVAINELGGSAGGYIVDNGAFANYRVSLLRLPRSGI